MKCSNCGMPHPEGRLYCTNCGHTLQNPEVPVEVAASAAFTDLDVSQDSTPQAYGQNPTQQAANYQNPAPLPGNYGQNPGPQAGGYYDYAAGAAKPPRTRGTSSFMASLKDGSLWFKIARIAIYVMGGLIIFYSLFNALIAYMPMGLKVLVVFVSLIASAAAAVVAMTLGMLFVDKVENTRKLTKQNEEIIELLKK